MKIQMYPIIKSEAYEPKEKEIDPVTKMIDDFFKPSVKKNLISLDDGKDYIKDTIKNYHLSE